MQTYFPQGFFAANLIIVIIFLHKIFAIEFVRINSVLHVFCNKNVDPSKMPDFGIFDLSELYDLVEQLQVEVHSRIKKMEPESNGSVDGLIPAIA
jgi:hypothetical protein